MKEGEAEREKLKNCHCQYAGIIQCCRNEMIIAGQVRWMSFQTENLDAKVNAFETRA